jgi:tetratricopeptide (TPR) repeat protein
VIRRSRPMLELVRAVRAWACVVAAGATAAAGQVASPPRPQATTTDVARFAADAAHRLSVLDLRACGVPGAGDFTIAADLLGIAQELAPDDLGIVRRRAEAAWNAGDSDLLLALTRRIVELDPGDTVAQLRLIAAGIGRLQTAAERLESYDRLLGPRGRVLDPSVRSRLALDAALLLRERGDMPGFVARLKDAVTLDATNKDAALLAHTFFAQRSGDPLGRTELLANLLYADPLDPKVHRALRDEFAAAGAYEAARRFHAAMLQIEAAAGNKTPENAASEGYVIMWMLEGPRAVADDLTLQVESRRASVRTAGQRDPTKVAEPTVLREQDVRLDVEYEQLRALTCYADGDSERLAGSMHDLALTVVSRAEALSDVTRRPVGLTPEDAAQRALDYIVELQVLRMVLRTDVDQGREEFDKALADLPEADPRRTDIQVWRHITAGEHQAALDLVKAKGATLWARLAEATALEALGDKPTACARYDAMARSNPLHPLGAFAAWRAKEAGGEPEFAGLSQRLDAYARTIPLWIEEMIRTPHLSQSLAVDLDAVEAAPLQHVDALVRVKNLSPIPLAVGSGRSINSRLFFGPYLELGARTRSDNAAGEVFDIDHRFRLMPGESYTVTLWPEVGLVGWLQQVGSWSSSRLRWRVFQGIETLPTGEKRLGPGCLETNTQNVTRPPLDEARLPTPKLAQRFAGATPEEVPALLVASCARVMGGIPGGVPDPESQAIVDALVAAYPSWPELVRISAVCVLPPVKVCPVLAPFDEAARRDADGRVMAFVIATRCADPQDPWLVSAASSSDTRIARLARLHQERLKVGGRVYADDGTRAMPIPRPEGAPAPAPK